MRKGSTDRAGNGVHGLARHRLQTANSADHMRQVMRRVLLPPLLISLAIVSAATLLLTAAAIAPPPLPRAVAEAPLTAMAVATPRAEPAIMMLGQIAGVALPLTPAVIDLARLIYAPGAGGDRHALPGPLLLAVESGVLTVDLGGTAQLLSPDQVGPVGAGRFTLHAGDGLLLPLATSAAFSNGGSAPVVALAAGVFPTAPTSSKLGHGAPPHWAEDWSPGATVQLLAVGWLVDTTSGSAAIALRRLSLRPGEATPLTAPGSLVLAVETGALTLVLRQGLAWQHPLGPDVWIAPGSDATLLPDNGALLQEGASVTLRNAGSGPVLVLALTVEPDGIATPQAAGDETSPEDS
jgi:quercetin dioxygenase-like cupin family protein